MLETWVHPWVGKTPWRRDRNPLQYSCLQNPHRQRSLVGYSPWGWKDLDTAEWLTQTHRVPMSVSLWHIVPSVCTPMCVHVHGPLSHNRVLRTHWHMTLWLGRPGQTLCASRKPLPLGSAPHPWAGLRLCPQAALQALLLGTGRSFLCDCGHPSCVHPPVTVCLKVAGAPPSRGQLIPWWMHAYGGIQLGACCLWVNPELPSFCCGGSSQEAS